MPTIQVFDRNLRRMLNHDHTPAMSGLYLLKAGDTATGTIYFPITFTQGNAFINSINAGTIQINAARLQLWPRIFLTMGS